MYHLSIIRLTLSTHRMTGLELTLFRHILPLPQPHCTHHNFHWRCSSGHRWWWLGHLAWPWVAISHRASLAAQTALHSLIEHPHGHPLHAAPWVGAALHQSSRPLFHLNAIHRASPPTPPTSPPLLMHLCSCECLDLTPHDPRALPPLRRVLDASQSNPSTSTSLDGSDGER